MAEGRLWYPGGIAAAIERARELDELLWQTPFEDIERSTELENELKFVNEYLRQSPEQTKYTIKRRPEWQRREPPKIETIGEARGNPGHNPGGKEPVTYTVFFERPDLPYTFIEGMPTPVGIEHLSSVSDANKAIKSMLEDAVREHPTVAGSSKINQIRVVKTVGEHSTELYRWTGVDIHRPSDYQIPLTKAEHHSWSTPRALGAAATGVITGVLRSPLVPIIGLAGGILAQAAETQSPQLRKAQYITAGVIDGSAALLARSLFRSVQARPMKLTLSEEELDKLEFEAAKKGEYVPSPPRPTKEQFKEILREKLLAIGKEKD